MPDNLANPLDERITRVLESPRPVAVSADFAARVAADASARFGPLTPASHPIRLRFGLFAIRLACVLLIAAMLLAARYSPADLTLILEGTLCAEFVALTLYLGLSGKAL